MESGNCYENFENKDTVSTTGPQTPSRRQDEEKAQKCRGSRCLVLMTVCLGIMCVLLLVFIKLQYISITAEGDSLLEICRNTVEEFNQTINSLEANYTENKLKLETRVNNLTAEKGQLESKVTSLSDELKEAYKQGYQWGWFFVPSELSWSDSRQYCRDRGADLIIINTEEKQRFITSLVKEKVWIGLTDIQQEGSMTWVDNSPLKQGFWNTGEPNDVGNEDCVELMPSSPVLSWNDLSCSNKRKGICEK